jgi:addiction module HigA family antidote
MALRSQEYVAQRGTWSPTHPGALLRDTVLPALNISVTEAAGYLRVTRQQLHRLLAETAGVSPEMALRLGKFCGNGPDLWLNMQQRCDVWRAAQKIGKSRPSRPCTICLAPSHRTSVARPAQLAGLFSSPSSRGSNMSRFH